MTGVQTCALPIFESDRVRERLETIAYIHKGLRILFRDEMSEGSPGKYLQAPGWRDEIQAELPGYLRRPQDDGQSGERTRHRYYGRDVSTKTN